MDNKILLTTVFKPFAVDDMFSRKENIPELMMSQVTRVQGIFSYRAWHANAGLHLIAANCGFDTTVLEWPSIEEFSECIRLTFYDHIGISFIPSTFGKMREMAKIIRRISPKSKIIVGGHGVMMPDLELVVDVDYVCKGDGIRFLRNLLGKPPVFSFNHPVVKNVITEFLGVPVPFKQIGEIVTGLGCRNGCEFCVTSAFFDCVYQPFLSHGGEVYDLLKSHYSSSNLKNFWIIDENFLSDCTRIEQLLLAIENDSLKLPDISIDMIWSTGDCVTAYSPAQLARMGITRVWMGYESMFSTYPKNRGIDFRNTVAELGEYGISVLLSCTAFDDVHNEATWHKEVETFIQLGQAYSQFLPLTAFPGTPLYKKMETTGRLVNSIPYEERHALTTAYHRHASIPIWKQERLLRDAYEGEYRRNGPSQLRDIAIRAKGCITMRQSNDVILRQRALYIESQLASQASWILAVRNHAEDSGYGVMIDGVIELVSEATGASVMKDAAEKAVFFEKIIRRGLEERNGSEVAVREPGLRVTRYDGVHAEPVSVRNPAVW